MYSWVSNERKLIRAQLELKKAGQEITEEALKAKYISYGGLVLEDEPADDEDEAEEKPKRKAKKAE